MQDIVDEILILDKLVSNYVEEDAIVAIDYCITKYGEYIKRIGNITRPKVEVIEDDPELYDTKDDVEINSDVVYIRNCLIIIGAVLSGIRPSFESVIREINGEDNG